MTKKRSGDGVKRRVDNKGPKPPSATLAPATGTAPLQARLRALLTKCDQYLQDRGPLESRAQAQRAIRRADERQRLSSGYAKKKEPAASPAWHAEAIGRVCDELLTRLEAGQSDDAAVELAIELGRKLSEWEWQHAYGQAIETGLPVRRGSRKGRKFGGRPKAETTDANLSAIRKLRDGGKSVTAACRIVAKGNLTKATALRALYYDHGEHKKL